MSESAACRQRKSKYLFLCSNSVSEETHINYSDSTSFGHASLNADRAASRAILRECVADVLAAHHCDVYKLVVLQSHTVPVSFA